MELLQLKYFQTIAKTQHISKAALELHIAQPSLSLTLKRLETELGSPLFDRIGKRIVLNDAGKIFLLHVEEVFRSLDNAQEKLNTLSQKEKKQVCILLHSASLLLPDLLKNIKEKDSSIQLQIMQQHTLGLQQGDLLISSSYEKPKSEQHLLLLEESLVVAFPRNHPLLNKDFITLKDLENESFISLNTSSNLFQIMQFYCEEKGFSPHISMFVDTPNIMRDLLRLNLGIAFIPEQTWHDFASETVVVKKLSDCDMTRYITLSWQEHKYLTPAICTCKEEIISFFTKYTRQFPK